MFDYIRSLFKLAQLLTISSDFVHEYQLKRYDIARTAFSDELNRSRKILRVLRTLNHVPGAASAEEACRAAIEISDIRLRQHSAVLTPMKGSDLFIKCRAIERYRDELSDAVDNALAFVEKIDAI